MQCGARQGSRRNSRHRGANPLTSRAAIISRFCQLTRCILYLSVVVPAPFCRCQLIGDSDFAAPTLVAELTCPKLADSVLAVDALTIHFSTLRRWIQLTTIGALRSGLCGRCLGVFGVVFDAMIDSQPVEIRHVTLDAYTVLLPEFARDVKLFQRPPLHRVNGAFDVGVSFDFVVVSNHGSESELNRCASEM